MVNALLIESPGGVLPCLETLILGTCPEVNISRKADSLADVYHQLREMQPELMFVDIDNLKEGEIELFDNFIAADFEVIFVTTTVDYALKAIKYGASGYIIKPVNKDELVFAVNHAVQKIKRKEEQARNKHLLNQLIQHHVHDRIIGIPTLEGFEFLHIDEIIRCEGLQKCTRIITIEKTDMISSYNLGEFCRLLEPHGFFSPHKSHLINLKYIRKYNREGSIIMHNGTYVPVSKRRKKDFLNQFIHF